MLASLPLVFPINCGTEIDAAPPRYEGNHSGCVACADLGGAGGRPRNRFRVISPIFSQLVSFAMPPEFSPWCSRTPRTATTSAKRLLKGETPERLDADDHRDRREGA